MAAGNSFAHWIPLYRICIADLPEYGNFPAAYAIRNCTTGEVLKYGNTKHFRQRIFMNFICGWGGSNPEATTQRVYSELYDNRMIECVEVAWIRTKDKEEAERLEKQFRQTYKETHGGLWPCWDRKD
jgi:hypothetical protein